jgi:transcriptional regulator with XRE-family HTH domain
MQVSSILQQAERTELAAAIGHELRRLRRSAGLSQAAVASPFSRAYVCAVEQGRSLPSIPALGVLLGHLGVGFDEFFSGVQREMTMRYTRGHGDRQEAPARRRR